MSAKEFNKLSKEQLESKLKDLEESLVNSSQIWMTGTDKNIFKKLEKSANLQYFVINDSNITQLVDL